MSSSSANSSLLKKWSPKQLNLLTGYLRITILATTALELIYEVCLIQKKFGNAKQVTEGMCTILREGTGRGRYPTESDLKAFRILGGAPFMAAQRSVFAHLPEQVPRKKYDASRRQQTEKKRWAMPGPLLMANRR
jgi:hypothetical protein